MTRTIGNNSSQGGDEADIEEEKGRRGRVGQEEKSKRE
jgi:hypothetical protein